MLIYAPPVWHAQKRHWRDFGAFALRYHSVSQQCRYRTTKINRYSNNYYDTMSLQYVPRRRYYHWFHSIRPIPIIRYRTVKILYVYATTRPRCNRLRSTWVPILISYCLMFTLFETSGLYQIECKQLQWRILSVVQSPNIITIRWHIWKFKNQ